MKFLTTLIAILLFQIVGIEIFSNDFDDCKHNVNHIKFIDFKVDSVYVLNSPYDKNCQYKYKINLHAHTTNRGDWYAYSPVELMERAREYGFDAIAITDLPDAGGIVEDPGVPGILHIPGIEYGGTPHLIGLGIDSLTISDNKQDQIDHIKLQNGLVYIPHPHFGNYDEEMLGELENYDGIAVFNSLTWDVAVYEGRESNVISYNERVIDAMLSNGRDIAIIVEEDTKYEGPHYNPVHNKIVDFGHQLNTAWMMVCGELPVYRIAVNDILESVKEKNFTSHARPLRSDPEPPNFVNITTDGLMLSVQIDKKSDIKFIAANGEVVKIIKNSTHGVYEAKPYDKYIRVRVTYTKNNYSSWAWSNAIYIKMKYKQKK